MVMAIQSSIDFPTLYSKGQVKLAKQWIPEEDSMYKDTTMKV